MSGIFKRKGIYIALIIIFTLCLAAVAFFAFTGHGFGTDFPGQPPQDFQPGEMPEGFGEGEFQLPEGFGDGSFQAPDGFGEGSFQLPEGFGGDELQLPADSEGDSAENAARPSGDFAAEAGEAAAFIPGFADKRLIILTALLAAADVFSVIMLIVVSRRQKARLRSESSEAEEEILPPQRKKSNFLPLLVIFVASALLVFQFLPENAQQELIRVDEKLVESTVQQGSISRSLISGGSISETTAKALSLAGEIKVKEYLVSSGDYVQEGQSIAVADGDSVILAIAELSALMAELDAEIDLSRNDVIENAIYAPAAGRVKAIYAQSGDKVQETVAEHSCLLRLSLDGLMAVDIPAAEGMQAGMAVTVRLPDGSLIPGRVEKLFEGEASITLSDEQAPYGEQADILDSDSSLLGSGTLYIHKEVKISGMSGTVQRLNVTENLQVGTDMALVVLGDTAYRGNHDLLTARRRLMEQELSRLFEIYNSGEIKAPCTGRIVALNEELTAEALASQGSAALMLLAEGAAEMKSYAVLVEEITDEGINVSYTEGKDTVRQLLDLKASAVFLYKEGSFIPCTLEQIRPGDALALVTYLDDNGSESLDHAVLYPASSGETPDGGISQGGAQGSGSQGDMSSGSMSGGGMSSGSTGGGNSAGSSGFSSGMSFSAGTAEEEDEYAFAKTVLAYITPFDTADIVISVDEQDIANYRIGQSLQVELHAMPGRSFQGEVTLIDPNGNYDDGGGTKYSVTVSIPREADMLTGMNASLSLKLDEKADIPIVPLAAINEKNGEVFVYTGYDSETDTLINPVSVETGVSDGEFVELVSGLSVGDGFFYRLADSINYSFQ